MKEHKYNLEIEWTGNKGEGTQTYNSYDRSHIISKLGKYDSIIGSSDPHFRGDEKLYNPEELFIASISSCHMLWYLHLCADHGIVVTEYKDSPMGVMTLDSQGSGRFTSIWLSPKVTISDLNQKELAIQLHDEANKMCFIANSCNFKIQHTVTIS